MIRLSMGAAALVTALLAGTGAQAAAERADALDAQCMVRASIAEAQLPPQGKANATDMVFYYMGRMVGRNPKVDIAKEAKDALAAVQSKDKGPAIAARCDKDLREAADTLQKYGAALHAKP
jgi:hypothetical protein